MAKVKTKIVVRQPTQKELDVCARNIGSNFGVPGAAPIGTNPKDLLGCKKPSITKVPPAAIIYMSLAMMDGARKYGAYNWRKNKVILSIYFDACFRHLMAFWDGEENAADSGRPHLAHALASIGIVVDALETGNLVDDRPEPGAAAKLIERYTVK